MIKVLTEVNTMGFVHLRHGRTSFELEDWTGKGTVRSFLAGSLNIGMENLTVAEAWIDVRA